MYRCPPARSRSLALLGGAILGLTLTLGSVSSDLHAAAATSQRAPTWVQLPAGQKAFLAPLAENWDALSVTTRRKLIGIAQRQSQMTREQKERVQARLPQWAQMSAEDRELARRNYQQLNRLPADQRQEVTRRWQEAQQQAPSAPPQRVSPDTAAADPAAPASQ